MVEKKASTSPRLVPTADDVARRAGVSRTAVSYVLNEKGQRNKHVSEETRAKVLQAVQELNFRPHALARALSRGYSEELVYILGTGLTPFALEFITTLQDQASLHGYTLVMYLGEKLSAEEREALYQTIFARRPIGIITGDTSFTAEDVALARQMGVQHIVFIGFHVKPIEHTYSIVFPSYALGYLATQHLLERGHRRLALVHPDESVQEDAFQQRLEGMRAAIAETPDVTLDILPLHLSASAAHSLVETTFAHAEHPTGVYAFSDPYAIVLLGALTRQGMRIPQDVALVGTDNLPVGTFVWPALTSLCFDALDMGKRAFDILHTLHQGLPLPEPLTRPLIPQLIVREST